MAVPMSLSPCPIAPTLTSQPRRGLRRWRAMAVVAALATTVASIAVGAPPAVAATIDTGAAYVLINRYSGMSIDDYGWSTNEGSAIVQYTRNDYGAQQWKFVDSGSGYYRLQSAYSGKVISIQDSSTADGAGVVQTTDTNAANQQFKVVDTGDGHIRLLNRNSGKALEDWGWSTEAGAALAQYTDTGYDNQQWRMLKVGGEATTAPSSYPDPDPVAGDFYVHDPSMVKTAVNTYLAASTGSGIPLRTSTDRAAWTYTGVAFPNGMSWVYSYTSNSDFVWAPDIQYVNGTYYMYYAASTSGSQNSGIFLATSTTGKPGEWTNKGLVISSSSSNDYNAIDPSLVIDASGTWWLTFGSFWTGIKMIKIDSSTGARSGSSFYSLASHSGGIEAPTIIRHGSYYYLFVAFDKCCNGASSTYRTMVGRSSSITGTYVDRNGSAMTSGSATEILAGHGSIHGPGAAGVISDVDGSILYYHWYASDDSARLGINRLGWDSSGWPFAY